MLSGGVTDAVAAMTSERVRRPRGPRRRRAGRSAAELVRTARRDAIRQSLPQLAIASAVLVAVGAGLSTMMLVWTGSAWWSGFLAGLMAGAILLLVQTILVGSGVAIRGYGVDAERWTAEKLDTLDRRQWSVFHDVPIERGNIDHVAVGPGRTYAVETKYTTSRGKFLGGAARQAERQARTLESVLRQGGAPRPVVPLLVLWGPGIRDRFSMPQMDGKTRVVAGFHAEDWLRRMAGAADRFHADLPATQALESHVARH
jgi:hypothetical protein